MWSDRRKRFGDNAKPHKSLEIRIGGVATSRPWRDPASREDHSQGKAAFDERVNMCISLKIQSVL